MCIPLALKVRLGGSGQRKFMFAFLLHEQRDIEYVHAYIDTVLNCIAIKN